LSFSAETFFRALAAEPRLRCLALLAQGELCVCDLTEVLGLAQPKVSRHLAYLRAAAIVLDQRRGRWIHYRLNPDLPSWARAVLASTVEGVRHEAPFAGDHARLSALSAREERCGSQPSDAAV
jgi:ArsR family transcriptional regulator